MTSGGCRGVGENVYEAPLFLRSQLCPEQGAGVSYCQVCPIPRCALLPGVPYSRVCLTLRGDRPEETRSEEVRSPLSGVYGRFVHSLKMFPQVGTSDLAA